MAHYKFSTLIKQNSKNYIVDRLKYYKHMNFLLILIVAFGAGLMFTFCIDGLSERQYLNRNKFTADLFAGIVNFFMATFWIVWCKYLIHISYIYNMLKLYSNLFIFFFLIVMIFYPRLVPTYSGKQYNDFSSKLSSPLTSPTSDSHSLRKDNSSHKKSLSVKRIEIKIDSTTTMNTDQVTYRNEYNNNINGYNNERYNNIQTDGYIQLPSPLATNNKQIISYTGSPRKYDHFI